MTTHCSLPVITFLFIFGLLLSLLSELLMKFHYGIFPYVLYDTPSSLLLSRVTLKPPLSVSSPLLNHRKASNSKMVISSPSLCQT